MPPPCARRHRATRPSKFAGRMAGKSTSWPLDIAQGEVLPNLILHHMHHPLHRATTGVYYEPYGICNGLLFRDFVKGGFDVRTYIWMCKNETILAL